MRDTIYQKVQSVLYSVESLIMRVKGSGNRRKDKVMNGKLITQGSRYRIVQYDKYHFTWEQRNGVRIVTSKSLSNLIKHIRTRDHKQSSNNNKPTA